MKKIIAAICTVTAVLLCVCGCGTLKNKDNGKIDVVVTAFPHYDFARQIGGDNINLTMLLKPGAEMHSYEPTPQDMALVSSCDVFIYTGGESETWVKEILASADNKDMTVIAFTDICPPLAYPDDGKEHSPHDGHNHVYDEHVWTSPKNAAVISEAIYTVFCGKDVQNTDAYTENFTRFEAELKELDGAFAAVTEEKVRDTIVVADRFPFIHMANEYGIRYISAFPGCSSQAEPSASTLAKMIEMLEQDDVPAVFTIEYSNGKIARTVTEGTDVEILTLHSCHNVSKDDFEKGVTYVSLMTQNAENLRKALT